MTGVRVVEQLAKDIQTILYETGGKWGIALEDLHTNETWRWNAYETFTAASIIKVPIMIAAFDEFDKGNFTLSEKLELKKEDLVGGSGVLQHMSPGLKLSVYDLVMLMIVQSDNTATNMLVDLIGKEAIQQTMQRIGLKESRFYNKLMTVPVNREGNNLVTASEMTNMLKKIATGKIISIYACEQMISILKKQQLRECLPGKLPSPEPELIGGIVDWELANKTGEVTKIRHDIGIFYVGKRAMAASVLSSDLESYASKQAFANIGLAVYRYLCS